MKISRLLTAFLLLTMVVMGAAAAGGASPVRWRSFVKTNPDGTGVVILRALVEPGWHLYGLDMPDGGPKATSFDFAASTGVKFTGDVKPSRKPVSSDDPLFGMTLTWWDSKVEFERPFKLVGEDAVVRCKISFMACDGTTCRPPSTENISIPVKKK